MENRKPDTTGLRHRNRCHGRQSAERLKNWGFADNTLVIFSADNGAETHAFERTTGSSNGVPVNTAE